MRFFCFLFFVLSLSFVQHAFASENDSEEEFIENDSPYNVHLEDICKNLQDLLPSESNTDRPLGFSGLYEQELPHATITSPLAQCIGVPHDRLVKTYNALWRYCVVPLAAFLVVILVVLVASRVFYK